MTNEQNINLIGNKKNLIIDSALTTISQKGYRKASIQDIAKTAGVSKSLVLYHFPNKIKLFSFLLMYCSTLISNQIGTSEILEEKDFFDRIFYVTQRKIQLIKSHKSLFSFMERVMHEDEPSINNEIKNFMIKNQSSALKIVLNKVDTDKFKPQINVEEVFKLIGYFSSGFFYSHPVIESKNMEQIVNELNSQLELLKISFYKEEYL